MGIPEEKSSPDFSESDNQLNIIIQFANEHDIMYDENHTRRENGDIFRYQFYFPESYTQKERVLLLLEIGSLIDKKFLSTEKFQIRSIENGFQVYRTSGYVPEFNAHMFRLGQYLMTELTRNYTPHIKV